MAEIKRIFDYKVECQELLAALEYTKLIDKVPLRVVAMLKAYPKRYLYLVEPEELYGTHPTWEYSCHDLAIPFFGTSMVQLKKYLMYCVEKREKEEMRDIATHYNKYIRR